MEQNAAKKSYRLCQIGWCFLITAGLVYGALCRKGIQPEAFLRLLPSCAFRSLTGAYCPGCGGTRAVLELFRGHIVASLRYHPVVGYTAALYGWYLLSNTVEWLSRGKIPVGSSYHRWYGYAAVILVAGNWILRNILLFVFHITL